MRNTICGPSTLMAVTLVGVLSVLPIGAAAEQRRGGSGGNRGSGGQRTGGGGERVGTAVPRGSSGGRSGDESSRGSGSGRSTPHDGTTASTGGGDRARQQGDEGASGSRPREGRPVVGRAEPRDDSGRGGRTTILVPGGYYGGFGPWGWGYGGFGFGGYYDGWYDPWYGGYGNPVYYNDDDPAGALRLKVKPHEAEVFVDGYYAGIVDEFDGVFQRLKLEPGPHRIEISSDGYEPLMFEIRALPDQTTTYRGSLAKRQ